MSRATPRPPAGRLIEVAGRRVHLLDEGHGPALVALHGAGGSLLDFTLSIQPALARRHRIIAFDRPGLGHSGALHGKGETPLEQARHLDAAAAELGVERAVILGHSFGGAVALAWALVNPARVAGLVILSGASMPWEGSAGWRYALIANPLSGAVLVPMAARALPRRLLERMVAEIFAPQRPPAGYLEGIDRALTLRPDVLRANARQINRLKGALRQMARAWPALDVPVEILHGTADGVLPIDVHARPLQAALPDARLSELAGIGHMPHHAAPDAVLAAVARAVARAGLSP